MLGGRAGSRRRAVTRPGRRLRSSQLVVADPVEMDAGAKWTLLLTLLATATQRQLQLHHGCITGTAFGAVSRSRRSRRNCMVELNPAVQRVLGRRIRLTGPATGKALETGLFLLGRVARNSSGFGQAAVRRSLWNRSAPAPGLCP